MNDYTKTAMGLTDHLIEAMADSNEKASLYTTSAVLRDYVRIRKLNVELQDCLKQAIDGCGGCPNVGRCGGPLPFNGCERENKWRKVLAEAE